MYFCASDVKPGPLAKQSIVWKSFLGENWHTELQKAKAAANIKWQMARNGMGIKMHAIKSAKWFTVKGGEIYGMQSVRRLFSRSKDLQELQDQNFGIKNRLQCGDFRFHRNAICRRWLVDWRKGVWPGQGLELKLDGFRLWNPFTETHMLINLRCLLLSIVWNVSQVLFAAYFVNHISNLHLTQSQMEMEMEMGMRIRSETFGWRLLAVCLYANQTCLFTKSQSDNKWWLPTAPSGWVGESTSFTRLSYRTNGASLY